MERTRLRQACSSGMACSNTQQQAAPLLGISGASMKNPVDKAPAFLRGRKQEDQRNVCHGGPGRGEQRDRGQRQRVDVRNRVHGGHGRNYKVRQGLQVGRYHRLASYSKDQVMVSGMDGVSEMMEGVYEEACRWSGKRAEMPWQEMTGHSHMDRVARVLAQRQKEKESDDVGGRVLVGPSPLELYFFAA